MGMKMALVTSALTRSISSAVRTLRDVFLDAFEGVVRQVGLWAKGTAIRFGFASALALLALFVLGQGLSELVAAAGLPAYAGYLIVAAVAGIAAAVLFKTGAQRRIRLEERDLDPGLRIRLVTPRRQRRALGSGRRVYDVQRGSGGWEVRGPRASRRTYRKKSLAVRAARRAARGESARVLLHGPDGRIRSL
jgi:hypothetical protein